MPDTVRFAPGIHDKPGYWDPITRFVSSTFFPSNATSTSAPSWPFQIGVKYRSPFTTYALTPRTLPSCMCFGLFLTCAVRSIGASLTMPSRITSLNGGTLYVPPLHLSFCCPITRISHSPCSPTCNFLLWRIMHVFLVVLADYLSGRACHHVLGHQVQPQQAVRSRPHPKIPHEFH